jgi:hypothetical protein
LESQIKGNIGILKINAIFVVAFSYI